MRPRQTPPSWSTPMALWLPVSSAIWMSCGSAMTHILLFVRARGHDSTEARGVSTERGARHRPSKAATARNPSLRPSRMDRMRRWMRNQGCCQARSVTAARQRERERRSLSHLTLHPDPPAVQLYKLPAQGEPQPRALRLLLRPAHLPEFLEHCLLVFGSNSNAGIRHRDLGHPVDEAGTHVDAAALRRELQGVREEVQQDLLHLPLVPANLP